MFLIDTIKHNVEKKLKTWFIFLSNWFLVKITYFEPFFFSTSKILFYFKNNKKFEHLNVLWHIFFVTSVYVDFWPLLN